MFNIGIVCVNKHIKLVSLSNASLYLRDYGAYTRSTMTIWADGRLSRFNSGGLNEFTPGEWYTQGPSTGIGSSYEYRTELVAGIDITSGGTNGAWSPIGSSNRSIYWQNSGGRMLLSIRRVGDLNVSASALYWTDGYSP